MAQMLYELPGIATADLPASWSVGRVGAVITDIRPGFSSGQHTTADLGLAHLRPMNITRQGEISLNDVIHVQADSPLRATRGDVLFNNTNSPELVGKSAVLDQDGQWGYSNHLTRIRVPDILIPRFVAYQFLLLQLTGFFELTARRHVNQASISTRQLKELPLIVAPMEAQAALISTIERSYGRLDSISDAISRTLSSLDKFDSVTLREAAEGHLLAKTSATGTSPTWQSATVSEIGAVQLGKMREPKSHFGPQMRPYLRVANIFEDKIDISDVHEMNFTDAEFEKFKLEVGDVLLCEGQSPELVGRPAMFRGEIEDCCFQKTLIRFRPNPGNSSGFALLVFRHYLRSDRFKENARWSTNIAHLSAYRFAAMEYPQVPLNEQEATVEVAGGRLAQTSRIREALQELTRRVPQAREVVLLESFHIRKLPVPQSPDLLHPQAESRPERRTSMPGLRSTTPSSARRSLLEVLREYGDLDAHVLFAQAGYTKELVDDFYQELRQLVREGAVLEERTEAGSSLRLNEAVR